MYYLYFNSFEISGYTEITQIIAMVIKIFTALRTVFRIRYVRCNQQNEFFAANSKMVWLRSACHPFLDQINLKLSDLPIYHPQYSSSILTPFWIEISEEK